MRAMGNRGQLRRIGQRLDGSPGSQRESSVRYFGAGVAGWGRAKARSAASGLVLPEFVIPRYPERFSLRLRAEDLWPSPWLTGALEDSNS